MSYENRVLNESHELVLHDRQRAELTGIKKIESLNSEEFYIVSVQGDILIEGSELHMLNLDIEKGVLWISGQINSVIYINEQNKSKNKSSFLGKLFK